MANNIIIVNDDIRLELPKDKWAKKIYNIVDEQRAYLREWLPWVDKTTSISYIRTFLRESILFNRGGQRFTTFIFYKEELVGSISYVRINKEHQRGEIGYWLRKDFQGKGIITQSCAVLVKYGFTKLNLRRIEIRILDGNTRSMQIPIRLGFQHEGTMRDNAKLYKKFYNMELFSIIRSEWEALNLTISNS